MTNNYKHQLLNIDSLVPFSNHPFETYKGQRLADMIESVRINGVIIPIVVRPIKNNKYDKVGYLGETRQPQKQT